MLLVQAAPRPSERCACCGKTVSFFYQDDDFYLRLTPSGKAEFIHHRCAVGLGYRKQLVTVLFAPETKSNVLMQWYNRILKFLGR